MLLLAGLAQADDLDLFIQNQLAQDPPVSAMPAPAPRLPIAPPPPATATPSWPRVSTAALDGNDWVGLAGPGLAGKNCRLEIRPQGQIVKASALQCN